MATTLLNPILARAADQPVRVLFVGNSVTYVNNLPAMVSALAEANGKAIEARMLVKGGHTIAQHMATGVLAKALAGRSVDVLVLQEQGGTLLCFPPGACELSTRAHADAAALAKTAQAAVVILGTYQFGEARASEMLEEAEADIAVSSGTAARVAISESARAAMTRLPELEWLDQDGAHPGEDLSMFMAIKLYHAIFHDWPKTGALRVRGIDYAPAAHFSGREILREPGDSDATRSFSTGRIGALLDAARR